MAEDMFRQGPLWVDSGYRGDSVRHTQLFIKGSRGLTSELPKFVTKREPSALNMPQLVRCYVVLKCEGVGLLFLGNGDPTHRVPPIF